MDARAFHNALRIMRNIGENDLRRAGVIDENWGTFEAASRDQLGDFFRDPYAEAIRMPDDNFDRLFALIENRQPKRDAARPDCPNTGLPCIPGCTQRECAGLHVPLNEWPAPEPNDALEEGK